MSKDWGIIFFLCCLFVIPGLVLGFAMSVHDLIFVDSGRHKLDGPAMMVVSASWLGLIIYGVQWLIR